MSIIYHAPGKFGLTQTTDTSVYDRYHIGNQFEKIAEGLAATEMSGVPATVNRIMNLTNLPQDWDGEGSMPVELLSASRAERFVKKLYTQAFQEGFELLMPDVDALSTGGILLSWTINATRLMVHFKPDSGSIVVVFDDSHNLPGREECMFPQALTSVLAKLK